MTRIILASGSETRQRMLREVGVPFDVIVARIDESALREGMIAEGHPPRDIADALAEAKARKISLKHPGALVIGSDQVLEIDGSVLAKPETPDAARSQLAALSGRAHRLISAAVVHEDGRPLWRHVAMARMQMREIGPQYLTDYVDRNWDSIRHSVGGYKLEEEGARLFASVDGDPFTIYGMPLLPLLSWLVMRGTLQG